MYLCTQYSIQKGETNVDTTNVTAEKRGQRRRSCRVHFHFGPDLDAWKESIEDAGYSPKGLNLPLNLVTAVPIWEIYLQLYDWSRERETFIFAFLKFHVISCMFVIRNTFRKCRFYFLFDHGV